MQSFLISGLLAACLLLGYGSPDGKAPLKFAWSPDGTQWQAIGSGYGFLSSDFGPWGSSKRLYDPQLGYSPRQKTWYCSWKTLEDGSVVALTQSKDLLHWTSQLYIRPDGLAGRLPADLQRAEATRVTVGGEPVDGVRIEVDESLVKRLENHAFEQQARAALNAESVLDDARQFAGLRPVRVTLGVDVFKIKRISDHLMGVFFEDINYGADGGLYAELLQNRDFEYLPTDHDGWDALTAWTVRSGDAGISTEEPLHPNNPHHLRLTGPAVLENAGWDGIPLRAGSACDLSLFACGTGTVRAELLSPEGHTLAETTLALKAAKWQPVRTTLTPDADCADAVLRLHFPEGAFRIDLVSLFPQETFHGRKNGLRADLAQAIADLKPKFIRFPGGCVAHGNGLDNIYDWKGSVGPLEARKPLRNLWGYHQTRGLGYYEYFQFCEDIGAMPLPVLAAGVSCQNSSTPAHHTHDALTLYGQQDGLPMEEMDAYIQDILDLIEWANGPADSRWGSVRAAAGHPEPFGLKYLGIGNEDLISEAFEQRFRLIWQAVHKAHPEITVVGTVGPFNEGADYDAGWALARDLSLPLVDEHYYVSPGWMIHNQHYYDDYRRRGPKVYLGEYAAHNAGRRSNIESALAEALYLTSVERNADVVEMCSYAPLLARKDHHQWTPDLIWFDNLKVYPTVNYQVQKLFGQYSGQRYYTITSDFERGTPENVRRRIGISAVQDGFDYIVKIVNYLPVPLQAMILPELVPNEGFDVFRTTLSGDPADETAVPVEDQIHIGADPVSFPPYSLTVLRARL